MGCLRCGKESGEEQAFCLECQKEMARYPIDPNTVVKLPVRNQTAVKRQPKRRAAPEDQIRVLKLRLRVCALLLAAAVMAMVLMSIPLIRDYGKPSFQIGQNYSTVKPSTEPTAAEDS